MKHELYHHFDEIFLYFYIHSVLNLSVHFLPSDEYRPSKMSNIVKLFKIDVIYIVGTVDTCLNIEDV